MASPERDDKPSGEQSRRGRATSQGAGARAGKTGKTGKVGKVGKVGKAKPGRAKPGKGKGAVKKANAAGAPPAAEAARVLPVRADEDRWTPRELAEVRSRLEEEIGGLRAEIVAAETQIAEGDTSGGAGDDQADAGAKTYEREHEMALAYNARDLLDQNERAVARMDAGTYGVCESCGRAIGKARLQAFPRATLCVTCKQRQERR